ncbi:MAG: undecaprenyldiphospho-muramoylpentapeptide beta-N-acetylglucosaminyltransferase [Microbacteriaceae bacterium]|jgi:UDP-N-acetylglucosamine--N-acetylmuramyl-(pentapeptide) pyrophosphoryl-undecaprenol N-acetylglucosamine transferase|nr:undecaprenyldiphospho-muramoylpentapeptide beta-N-acetylglucosaminyltransferase [Microbacteriaceae bacterium]MCI1207399.1 undecaprenyldiphospho-muramoylpentapeptide beta-N-acetylglucosaminyltransferase [Microbacteriaceae bacterium]
MTTYLLAGGGTAGHVNPLLATAERLRSTRADAEVLVLGCAHGLESRLVPVRGFELLTIDRVPFPRRPDAAALRFPVRFRRAVRQAESYLRAREVDVLCGFGGYASTPAYVAAHRMGLPFVVHEANARPGLANRLGARWADRVAVTFPGTPLRGAQVTGMPLRPQIEQLNRVSARAEAVRFFGLEEGRPTLLVTGGSLGAATLNRTFVEAAAALTEAGWQVVHIGGDRLDVEDPGVPGYHLVGYCDRMELALAAADFAVSRSGASTVSELSALGIPAIYVPYPHGNGEQALNASAAVEAGAARLVTDAEVTPHWASTSLLELLNGPDREALSEGARRAAIRDGSARLADLIDEARDARRPEPGQEERA